MFALKERISNKYFNFRKKYAVLFHSAEKKPQSIKLAYYKSNIKSLILLNLKSIFYLS